jgi:hypothetical protein
MNFFTMTRRGSLVPKKHTTNQCKAEGHSRYYYEVKIVFSGLADLDADGFIVKHEDLDEAIQESPAVGSCEQMHLDIRERLHAFFKSKDLHYYVKGFKCTIYPTLADITEGAFMSCIYVENGSSPEVVGLLK